MEEKLHPCMHSDSHRQFDFWLGEWTVHFTANDVQAGTNTIRMDEDGCVIRESWKSAYGSTGSSLNFYDPATDKWTQIWTNSAGNVTHYSGGLVDGAMVFEGTNYPLNGEPFPNRMTLTPNDDGTVRQLIERSDDSGETWTVWFDAIYKPKADEEG
jgi:hypothetical protein